MILPKRQEDSLIIKLPTRKYHTSRPDLRKLPGVDQVIKPSNVVDFDILKEKDSMPSYVCRNEIILQCNMFTGDAEFESTRGIAISRYRQTQKNSIYFRDKPAVEMII